jgi:hypothetical protein
MSSSRSASGPIEPAQVHVRRVANGGKSRDPFGERRYKSGMLDEQGREIEAFDLVACFGSIPFVLGPNPSSVIVTGALATRQHF